MAKHRVLRSVRKSPVLSKIIHLFRKNDSAYAAQDFIRQLENGHEQSPVRITWPGPIEFEVGMKLFAT